MYFLLITRFWFSSCISCQFGQVCARGEDKLIQMFAKIRPQQGMDEI